MNIAKFISGMVIGNVVFVNIRIRSISRSIFLIVTAGLCLVSLVMILLRLMIILLVGVPGRKAVSDMALAIVLVICATVIVVTYMLCRVREREQDLEDVYEDISLLRVSVDRFNSIEEVNASNLSCLSDHLKHVDAEIDEIQNELCNRL